MPKERVGVKLTNTDRGWLHRAATLALISTCNQKHGAVIVKGGRVLSVGINSQRNIPSEDIPPSGIGYHAEVAALRALRGSGSAKGAKIYIARQMRCGKIGLSRPCNNCYKEIVAAGIKEIIYT